MLAAEKKIFRVEKFLIKISSADFHISDRFWAKICFNFLFYLVNLLNFGQMGQFRSDLHDSGGPLFFCSGFLVYMTTLATSWKILFRE